MKFQLVLVFALLSIIVSFASAEIKRVKPVDPITTTTTTSKTTKKVTHVTLNGKLLADGIRGQTKQQYKVRVILYDALLADTNNTIAKNEFKHYLRFPMNYSLRIPLKALEQSNRYALSVSIRDLKTDKLVYWTDTATFLVGRRLSYNLNLKKTA